MRPGSRMPEGLSAECKKFLLDLRQSPLFREMVEQLIASSPSKPLRWRRRQEYDQFQHWIYESGHLDGRDQFVQLLLGYDGENRRND